ncbi:MAG: trehalose-phosphatase [Thermodesulfobacteriota bacterium]
MSVARPMPHGPAQWPLPETGLEAPRLVRFWQRLPHRFHRTLLLDYDGTLAPFRAQRDEAVPFPGVRELLDAIIADRGCRLVVVSGRAIDDLIPLLGLQAAPEIWGSHGLERLHADGRRQRARLSARVRQGLEEAWLLAQAVGWPERCETKPGCVAWHWRGLSPAEARAPLARIHDAWTGIATRYGLALHPFDGGLELRTRHGNKGDAVRAVRRESGVHGIAAYLGDDLTDEDAFAALGDGDLGLLVRPQVRPSRAGVWLRPPEELLAFLAHWRALCAAGPCISQGGLHAPDRSRPHPSA